MSFSVICDGECTNCNHQKECELTLPYSKGLKKTQNQIIDTLKKLKEVEEDQKFCKDNPNIRIYLHDKNLENQKYELTEQLREYRRIEHKKIKLLQKRRELL